MSQASLSTHVLDLENAVLHAVGDFLTDRLRVIEALKLTDVAPGPLRAILETLEAIANQLEHGQPDCRRELLRHLIHEITLQVGSMRIQVKRTSLDLGDGLATRADLTAGQPGADLVQRLAVVFGQFVEYQPSRPVGERLEQLVHVISIGKSSLACCPTGSPGLRYRSTGGGSRSWSSK